MKFEQRDKNIPLTTVESNQNMIQHTIALLAQGGLQAATLQAVGDRVGLSRAVVARHFGCKEQLLIQVLSDLRLWFTTIITEATEQQHGLIAIQNLIKAIANHCDEHSAKFKAYFWLCSFGSETHQQLNRHLIAIRKEMANIYKKWLKEAVALEEITRNADLELMIDLIMSSLIGLIQAWMINPKFNLALRLKQLAEVHLRNMFKNSHLYYSANYWGT